MPVGPRRPHRLSARSRALVTAAAVLGIAGPLAVLGLTQSQVRGDDPAQILTGGPAAAVVPTGSGLVASPAAPVTPTTATPESAAPATTVPGAEGKPPTAPAYQDLSKTGVVLEGDGVPAAVRSGSARSGDGPLRHYSVSVEGGIEIDPAGFAAAVDATLADSQSWGAGGRLSFQRVAGGEVDFQVVLASPRTTDRLCAPLTTESSLSCGIGGVAVINAVRWQRGADAYAGQLPRYRQYVVTPAVGHTLGHGHEPCPAAGAKAPVMLQQTISVGDCVASPWPYPAG